MRNRSNLLVLIGIAFFVVGGIIVYVVTNDSGGSSSSGSSGAPVTVVVATHDIAAGSLADDMVKQGDLKETKVPSNQVIAGAVQSLNQLTGATFVQGFAADTQITSAGLQSLNRAFKVPDGYEAMAVQLDFVAGGAGYVNPGDHVNIYGSYGAQYPITGLRVPASKLLVTDVEVLDVNLTIPARRGSVDTSTPRASSDTVTFLVAVKTSDAERLVFDTEFEGLYATLLGKDAPASGPTVGRDGTNVLSTDPNAATH